MPKKKLTQKQKVLKIHPEAYAFKSTETSWFIMALSKPNKIEIGIGNGMTAREAWASADRRVRGTAK